MILNKKNCASLDTADSWALIVGSPAAAAAAAGLPSHGAGFGYVLYKYSRKSKNSHVGQSL